MGTVVLALWAAARGPARRHSRLITDPLPARALTVALRLIGVTMWRGRYGRLRGRRDPLSTSQSPTEMPRRSR